MELLGSLIGLFGGGYLVTAICLVSLGQPLRPVSHLLKATTFWFVTACIMFVVTLALVRYIG